MEAVSVVVLAKVEDGYLRVMPVVTLTSWAF